ncbi:hypothetical protein C1S86_11845 [Vibrio parahaemolyticus]|uniref:hypothetical protein n=1 Tax=Vibrio harveyi group TaxID=717610 RepID=UPI00047061FF|nr:MULTISPECIES: hypothetical protein [Vibrio harveyi group]ARR46720.1 hypothetical protein CAY59_20980 [Vibrio campbellii]EHK7404369.1 hypothetical protein [Vibrio parahaemolyticus]EIA1766332.1 hypothetical protein [Vibrio parahaemolyticus]EJE8673519.1 hypothetical protein [Vibrio parahaemolyticus]MDF4625007.1 hypothetical protein [Vibrio parahaemolyticus]
MSKIKIAVVSLKAASPLIGFAEDTLRKGARAGKYPSTVIKKVNGSWMIDTEEWDRWHREQHH